MKFGAMDPFKFVRTEALQQSPSRPAVNPAVRAGDFQLPRLKNGPATDMFMKSTNASSAAPAKAPAAHFSGGKIVPAAHSEGPALASNKPSLVATLFSGLPRIGENKALNMAKKPAPSGPLSILMSGISLGALASFVAGPAALLKPSLMNHLITSLPAKLP